MKKHFNPGYHMSKIPKGKLGEASKVLEEAQEFMDAEKQHCAVMALLELSDLIGAIKAYLSNRIPEMSLADLEAMADITKRAFESGRRK